MENQIDENQMITVLDTLYQKALDGIPGVCKPIDEIVNDYMSGKDSVDRAAGEGIYQLMIECGNQGYLTGLGKSIALPVAIPANMSGALFSQIKMAAALAKIARFDINSDQVRTMVYACLTGTDLPDTVKQTNIKPREIFTDSAITNIPETVLPSIHQKVANRLITRFGEDREINAAKPVSKEGAAAGGAFEIDVVKSIALNAYDVFVKKEIPDWDLIQRRFNISPKDQSENAKEEVSDPGDGAGEETLNMRKLKLSELKMPDIKAMDLKVSDLEVPDSEVSDIETPGDLKKP